jgi:hypothetical protein
MKKVVLAAIAGIGLVVLMAAQTKPSQTKTTQTKAVNHTAGNKQTGIAKKPVTRPMAVVYRGSIHPCSAPALCWAIKKD